MILFGDCDILSTLKTRYLVFIVYSEVMSETIDRTCCFTGHRTISPSDYHKIKENLTKAIIELIHHNYRFFGAGGALGFDTLAALTVLRLKENYPHIKLILVLPCLSQTSGWLEKDKKIYQWIKKQADKVVYTSPEYTPGCMHKRNRHLVDHSSFCICYLKKPMGGTAYTVDYALQKGRKVLNIAEINR